MSAGSSQTAQLAPILDRLQLKAEGSSVRIAMAIPEADVLKAAMGGTASLAEPVIINSPDAPAGTPEAAPDPAVIRLE